MWRTNTPTARAVLVLESRTGCSGFRITSTLNRDLFLSDMSDLRTIDLMIHFSSGRKACYPSILLNIRKCDNIKHTKKMYLNCVLCSVEDTVRL